jgi:hypothetical protein
MADLDVDRTRRTIVEKLDVLDDDIHVADDGSSLSFYVPTDQLEQARDVLDGEVEVLETYEHEYLVKISQ